MGLWSPLGAAPMVWSDGYVSTAELVRIKRGKPIFGKRKLILMHHPRSIPNQW